MTYSTFSHVPFVPIVTTSFPYVQKGAGYTIFCSTAAFAHPHSFSKTAKDAALAGAGELGRACKVAFTCGVEADPEVAASFLAKLTL